MCVCERERLEFPAENPRTPGKKVLKQKRLILLKNHDPDCRSKRTIQVDNEILWLLVKR